MILGRCPYCDDGVIEVRDKTVNSKKVKLYACSNANWIASEDNEFYELSKNSTCSFKIWQNALARYGKWLTYSDIKELLKNQELEVEFVSKKYGKKINYKKTVILNFEYGVSVIWD